MSAATAVVLDRAAALCERGWTQGTAARYDDGSPAECYRDNDAVCWCAIGAISRASYETEGEARVLYNASELALIEWSVSAVSGYNSITAWNDAPERTQAEVVAALREAARRERETP